MTAKADKPAWMCNPKLVKFITELEKHGNATTAMKKTKLNRGSMWHFRKTDPVFALVFEEARRCGLECMRDHGYDMAMGQLDEETFKVSDASMLRFLVQQQDKSFNPSQKVELAGDGLRPFMFQMVMNEGAMKDEKDGSE